MHTKHFHSPRSSFLPPCRVLHPGGHRLMTAGAMITCTCSRASCIWNQTVYTCFASAFFQHKVLKFMLHVSVICSFFLLSGSILYKPVYSLLLVDIWIVPSWGLNKTALNMLIFFCEHVLSLLGPIPWSTVTRS